MTDDPLPSAAEAEHLTVALRRAGVLGDGFVTGVVVDSSRDTLLSRIRRLRLSYRGASDAPDTVIFKTGLPACADDAMDVGRREVEFYTQVASVMPARLVPRCFGAEWRVDTSDWHILLEDLGDSHVIATQWPLPPTVAQCESIMRARARFHATWWDDPRLGASVGARLKAEDADREAQRLAEQFRRLAERMGDSLPRKSFELVEKLVEAAPRLLARAAVRDNFTIVHGDAHVWNCFLPRDPGSDDTRLFDWDSWRVGAASSDLAYMMAVHWYPDLRRERERPLLDHYHAALVAHGVSGYDRDPERQRPNFANARRRFAPYQGRVRQIADGAEAAPGVRAVAAYGHTPGHTCFHVADGDAQMMYLADTTHRPELTGRRPGFHTFFDFDPVAAEASRRPMLDRVAAERMRVTGFHFPFPATGHVAKEGEGYRFVAADWAASGV